MAGAHRVKRPRYSEPVWSAARGRGGGCEGSVRARAAAAAAVSATFGAAVVTIVADSSVALSQSARQPAPKPSAMDSIMPVSVERPTGARPSSPHTVGAPFVTAPVDSRSIASTAAAPLPDRGAANGNATSKGAVPRVAMSIGRRLEPAVVQTSALEERAPVRQGSATGHRSAVRQGSATGQRPAVRQGSATGQRSAVRQGSAARERPADGRRPVARSIGGLELSEQDVKRYRPGRPAGPR